MHVIKFALAKIPIIRRATWFASTYELLSSSQLSSSLVVRVSFILLSVNYRNNYQV